MKRDKGLALCACVKAVPDSDAITFDAATGRLRRDGAAAVINPYDLVALEVGLQCLAKAPGTLHAVSMGPSSATAALKTALAMGAEKAHLLSSPAFSGADVLATAYALSAFFAVHPADVILCGSHSADGDTGQTGAMLAETLGIAHAAGASEILEVLPDGLRVRQQLDGFGQVVYLPFPCLLVVRADSCYPRVPTLGDTLRARRQPIVTQDEHTLPGLDVARCGAKGSATRVAQVSVVQRTRAGRRLAMDALPQLADRLVREVYDGA
ncbi:MAG: hypothetical protein AB7V55_01710 [Oscillospiraceae bacterium]